MGNSTEPGGRSDTERAGSRNDLQMIGTQIREMNRLLKVRVEQENRRLQASGIDPVDEAAFSEGDDESDTPGDDTARYLIETLAVLDVFEEARIVLANGTTIEGRVNPITYTPNERLRLEIRPRNEDARYELRAAYTDDQWSTPVCRRYRSGEEDWVELGEVDTMRTLGH